MAERLVSVLCAEREPADTAANCKRFRSAIDDSFSEFLCPITHELPLDPVTATDGHVYERSAIEQWLETKFAKNEQVLNANRAALRMRIRNITVQICGNFWVTK